MQKDFQEWHNKKKFIHEGDIRVFFHEREVWWCSIGVNVGFEQDGKGDNFSRPVVIFKKFNNEVFWAVPVTTKVKTGKFYVSIDFGDGTERVAVVSQLRLIDAKRLYQKICVVSESSHYNLVKAVVNLCGVKV